MSPLRTARNESALRIVLLFIAQLLCVDASHSQTQFNPRFKAEVSRQETIYRSEGDHVPDGYTVDRSLANYVDALSSGFDESLAALGPGDRWLDIGAGKGQAILDYFTVNYDLSHLEGRERRGKKAQAVAMSIEDRRTADWRLSAANVGANQLQYLFNRRLREYSLDELGQFQVITDVIGGFSYTADLTLFMEKVTRFLATGGSFYTVLQDVRAEAGGNQPYYKDAPFLTEIANDTGGEVKICAWLKSISCVQATCESKKGWRPPLEAFHVQKVCDEVNVPALTPLHYEAGTPPERRFVLKN